MLKCFGFYYDCFIWIDYVISRNVVNTFYVKFIFFFLMLEIDISDFDPKDFMKNKSELRLRMEEKGTPGIFCFTTWFLTHLRDDKVVDDRKSKSRPMYQVKEVILFI